MVSFKNIATLLVAALPLGNTNPIPNTQAATDIAGKYIVTLKDGITASALSIHMNWVRGVHENSLGRRQLGFSGVDKTYGVGDFNAYAGHFDDETLERITNSADVSFDLGKFPFGPQVAMYSGADMTPFKVADVEPQLMYYPGALTTQKNSTHGLATISHRASGSTEYIYDDTAGEDTTVYVLDTGIDVEHPEFEGRASLGYNAVKGVPDKDVSGHGTHVAGTVGSKSYGVAKKTKLVDVKVFHDSGTTSEIILDGIEWAIKNITASQIQKKAVLNMSFGGGYSAAQNKLIKTAYDAGILCVIAAGNEGKDAKNSSPASSPDGITVGAVDSKWGLWESSNYGAVVHILAPGVDVLSTFPDGKTEVANGTSMASPHVAGLAAYLQAAENIGTVKELKDRIISLGTKGKATGVKRGTVNLVAYNGNK